MSDPTYEREKIEANPEWDVAFTLSEIFNDSAPLGWGKYIGRAQCLLAAYDMTKKNPRTAVGPTGKD